VQATAGINVAGKQSTGHQLGRLPQLPDGQCLQAVLVELHVCEALYRAMPEGVGSADRAAVSAPGRRALAIAGR